MSIRIMDQAFSLKATPTQKLIMICLADNANNEGVCFPSISTIEKKSGLSRRTIIDNIDKLSEQNLIIKKYRSRKKGGRSSNKYLLFPLENYTELTEDDYEIFKDEIMRITSKSVTDALPTQSVTDALGMCTQSVTDALESEPSLNTPNHHYRISDYGVFSEEEYKTLKSYRSFIKSPLKTQKAVTGLSNSFKECYDAGYTFKQLFDLMQEKQWQSIKLEWVKKEIALKKPKTNLIAAQF